MAQIIDDYINIFDGEKKEWLTTFVTFMRENYPEIPEVISYQMPMYKFNDTYIAFSLAKEHFTYHSLDFEMIEELKNQLPKAKFGKGSAKVSYNDREYIPILFEMSHRIVDRSKTIKSKKPA